MNVVAELADLDDIADYLQGKRALEPVDDDNVFIFNRIDVTEEQPTAEEQTTTESDWYDASPSKY